MAPQNGGVSDWHGVEPFEYPLLDIQEEPVRRVRDATGDGDQKDAWQQVVHVVVRPRLDRAAEHVYEQQHEQDRHEGDLDDGIHAAEDVPHGTPQQHAHVTEKVYSLHLLYLLESYAGISPPASAAFRHTQLSRAETAS